MSKTLSLLDTGITRLGTEEIPIAKVHMPDEWKTSLHKDLKKGRGLYVKEGQDNGDHVIFTREKNKLVARKLVTYHEKPDGTEVKFDAQEESDGSQRIMDLLPAFLKLSSRNSQAVWVIDEIDRSLHTLLVRQLIEQYLSLSLIHI